MITLHPLIVSYIEENYSLFGPRKVAKKLGITEASVIKCAKEKNIKLSKTDGIGLKMPEFKYDLRFFNRFKNLDEKLAYWIGFFWADGYLANNSNLAIEIIEEDGESLKELFLSIFQFRVNTRKRRNKNGQMCFRICDKDVASILKSLGKYPHSSESHKKIFEYLQDKKLQISFLRGLIDGDGNFYWDKKEKYGQFTLASNYEQDWSFLCEFLKDFNPHIFRDINSCGKSSVLRITGRDNMINFIEYLNYENNGIGLKRKINCALNILYEYKQNKPKKLTKHVFQYTKDGKLIKEYNSVDEASKAICVGKSAIGNCLCGLSKSSGGFIWRYN